MTQIVYLQVGRVCEIIYLTSSAQVSRKLRPDDSALPQFILEQGAHFFPGRSTQFSIL